MHQLRKIKLLSAPQKLEIQRPVSQEMPGKRAVDSAVALLCVAGFQAPIAKCELC